METLDEVLGRARGSWLAHRRGLDFWMAIPLGSTVHYYDGTGAFVRCTVVEADEDHWNHEGYAEPGIRSLRPVALVGQWEHTEWWRERIEAGEMFRPYYGNLYEATGFSLWPWDDIGDPTTMEPLVIA